MTHNPLVLDSSPSERTNKIIEINKLPLNPYPPPSGKISKSKLKKPHS